MGPLTYILPLRFSTRNSNCNGLRCFLYLLWRVLVQFAFGLSLFLFVWGIWLGGATGIRDQRQIRVEIADLIIPHQIQLVLAPLITVASAVFICIAVYLSLDVVALQADAIYDTLPISRGWLFVVVPLVGSVIFLQLVRVFILQIKQFQAQEGSR